MSHVLLQNNLPHDQVTIGIVRAGGCLAVVAQCLPAFYFCLITLTCSYYSSMPSQPPSEREGAD